MAAGAVNHLCLWVTDIERSFAFYRPMLEFLGYRALRYQDKGFFRRTDGPGDIVLYSTGQPVDPGPSGLHHLAFNALSRAQVDQFYQLLLNMEATVLDPPVDCPEYSAGYYAVFFADPDGLKLELAYTPNGIFRKPW